MIPPPPPSDEVRRIEALRLYAVLDTPPESALDDLTALAAQICGTPIALISLVDEHRQWFKSRIGLETAETSRDISFCAHALRQTDLLIVPDATQDERFAQYSNVLGEPGIRFYAGAPLITPEGAVLGTLCVIDQVPRTLTKAHEQALRVLARQVMTHLELRLNHERFQIVARATNDAVWDWNLDTNALWWNDGYRTLFGYLPEQTKPNLESWTDFLHPEDKDRVLQHVQEVIDHRGHAWSGEYRFRRRDGTYADIFDRGYLIQDAQGKPVRMIGAMQDITERKQAEGLLQASEESYRSMFQANPLPMFVYDLETFRFLAVNQTAIQTYGYSEAEFLALTIRDIRPAEDLPRLDQALKALEPGKKTFGVWRHRKKNGDLIDVEISSDSIVLGKRQARLVLANDITVRKRAEEELRRSEASLANAQRIAKMGNWDLDIQTQKLFWSEQIYEMFGITKAEFGATYQAFFATVHPEDRERMDAAQRSALAGTSRLDIEHRIILPDGSVKTVHELGDLTLDSDGRPAHLTGTVHDVTEQRCAQEAIRRQAHMLNQIGQAVIATDPAGRIIYANRFAGDLYGWTPEEMLNRDIIEVTVPQTTRKQAHEIMARLQKGESWSGEFLVHARDGRIFPALVTDSPLLDDGGKLIGIIGISTDITERKKSEEHLTLLNTCISKLNDVVMITEAEPLDEPGPRIVFVNKAFERMTGYTLPEAIGRTPRLFQGPKTDRHTLKEIRLALEQQRPIRTEIINYGKDGTEYWLDIDIVPIFDSTGKCTHFAAIERDITREKKAEEQIAEQAAFMDKARDAILVRDLEGNVLYWNKGAEHMYGWTRQEVVGRNICQLMYADPKRFEEVKSLTISRGEWSGEVQHLTKDRRELAVETSWTLIRDQMGQPKSLLAINTDVTARKKIEAQFMRAQRMESIGTLAGGVAHDLNNILAPILMSIDILKLSATDPQAANILETIGVSAKRGADIVRQVLSFARGMEGERIAVQPRHLVKDIETIIKDTFPKNIRLEVSVPKESWMILGDPTQLHQILLNLCVNGRDAMPDGGSLTVTVENVLLDEQYAAMHIQAKAGRYVSINVTDSGTGIPTAILDKIFDPFFTTKEVGKGTGLGLSTAIAIVNSHGGFINVYSELGKGATFKVYLPAMEEASSETRKATAELPKLPRGNGETILIVDDEASIRTVTGQTLQAFGYQVLTAVDGAEAVAIYAQHQDKISVVLTDMAMPVMDGPATVRALVKINPAIKIIAASGLNANGGVTKVSGLNVKQFLAKPYTAETLLTTIRAILDET